MMAPARAWRLGPSGRRGYGRDQVDLLVEKRRERCGGRLRRQEVGQVAPRGAGGHQGGNGGDRSVPQREAGGRPQSPRIGCRVPVASTASQETTSKIGDGVTLLTGRHSRRPGPRESCGQLSASSGEAQVSNHVVTMDTNDPDLLG